MHQYELPFRPYFFELYAYTEPSRGWWGSVDNKGKIHITARKTNLGKWQWFLANRRGVYESVGGSWDKVIYNWLIKESAYDTDKYCQYRTLLKINPTLRDRVTNNHVLKELYIYQGLKAVANSKVGIL